MRSLLFLFALTLTPPWATVAAAQAAQAAGPAVHVIAPTQATRLEARRIARFCRWAQTDSLGEADAILAVVRSSSTEPLESTYRSLGWLRNRAEGQLNESGSFYHVYLFSIRGTDLFEQLSHQSYSASPGNDVHGNPAERRPNLSGLPCGL